jgi:hypothetical protein
MGYGLGHRFGSNSPIAFRVDAGRSWREADLTEA